VSLSSIYRTNIHIQMYFNIWNKYNLRVALVTGREVTDDGGNSVTAVTACSVQGFEFRQLQIFFSSLCSDLLWGLASEFQALFVSG
jgi:hypothetical protein